MSSVSGKVAFVIVLALAAVLAACTKPEKPEASSSAPPPPPTPAAVTPEQARAIAKEAYVYGFPMVDNYRVSTRTSSTRRIPSTRVTGTRSTTRARVYTPEDTAIQTPNSDTPYSALGADLRAEPLVLTVPPIEQDRYYSLQFIDGYTYNFAYVGSRTTGNGGGKYLLAGPDWNGDTPEGIDKVIRSRHRPRLRAVPHATVRSGRPRHREEDPGRLPGHSRCRRS